jgi:hypothetical protein
MEKIYVVYKPLQSVAGLTYYHQQIVWEKSNGSVSMLSANYTGNPVVTSASVVQGDVAANTQGAQSVWGKLEVKLLDASNTKAEGFFGDSSSGSYQDYQKIEVVSSPYSQLLTWNKMRQAAGEINDQNLQYGPTTQNSNSAVSTELAAAGIIIPANAPWSPGANRVFGTSQTAFSNGSTPAPCFLAGTPILRPDGTSTPIEQIQAGDEVATYNGDLLNSTIIAGTVRRVFGNITREVIGITYHAAGQNHTIYHTPLHVMQTPKGFMQARDALMQQVPFVEMNV